MIDVVLVAGTILVGRVTDQHRVPVVGAQVRAKPATGAAIDAFTDEAGGYRIGPISGGVELVATAYGHAETKHALELAPTGGKVAAERRQDIVLTAADAVLAGTLDDTGGAPLAGAHVEIIAGGGEGRQTVVAADGTFAIDMLPAGKLRVRITHADYPPIELDATATPNDREKVRLRVPLGGAIEGALLDDTTGAPLAGVLVSGFGPHGATADATSDPAGRWKLGPLRSGRWKLAIDHPGYLPAKRDVDVPAARAPGTTSVHDIRFDLQRGALVGGTMRDSRGQRVANASVTVQAGADGPTAVGTTDTEGEFRIRDVPTGEVTVAVTKPPLRGTTRVTLRAGDEVLGLAIELR
jgi:hypothetical protein